MTSQAKPIPEGHDAAVPYLVIKDAARAIDFYKRVFGAAEVVRLAEPGGRIGHAELRVGRAAFMLADEHPELGIHGPDASGGSPVTIHLYVDDVDAAVQRAEAAGAAVLKPPKDEFYGDRAAKLKDPFGHIWMLATRIEEVSVEEMKRRFDAFFQS